MSNPSRRKFLKGVGATLASVGVAATTPAAVNGSTYAGSARQTITGDALAVLVVEQLSAWAATGRTFTAYEITRALRHQHPSMVIGHADVRVIVHDRMALLIERQYYSQRVVQFPTGAAIEYVAL